MRIGIFGYGNLGRGVELAVRGNSDAELVCVFTRRNPREVTTATGADVRAAAEAAAFEGKIDVLVVCAGSNADLPHLTPELAEHFCTVDSFDAHARIPGHYRAVDASAARTGHTALIAGGWDPGLFSLFRLYAAAVTPGARTQTFWGPGVSQGHSEAVRGIPGVLDARQYTIPDPEAVEAARRGEARLLSMQRTHRRKCFVVLKDGADAAEIERKIREMPGYFAGFDTSVEFVSREDMALHHATLPHGGLVVCSGGTGLDGKHRVNAEVCIRMDSNPEFTGNVLVALARAAFRMQSRGETGAKTVFDVRPTDLSPLTPEALRAQLL